MRFGIEESSIEKIVAVFEANPKVDKAIVFGSRAKGNYRKDSDIDIALKGNELTFDDLLQMGSQLDDLNLPYKTDLLDYHTISEPALAEHIDRVGIEFYSRWKEYKLGDIVDIINGFAFKSTDFLENSVENSLPIIKIKNVANGDVNLKYVQFHLYSEKLSRYVIKKGDILISLTGNHPELQTQVVGLVSKYKLDCKALLNQRVAKIYSKDNEKLSNDYIYYFLKDTDTHHYLASQSSGSANQANISKSDIENTFIILPPLSEQTAIAAILSSLDDKIDLLQRQNKTLEQLAETLFRHWFVEEAEESWEVGKLEEVISVKGGTTPSTANPEFWDGNINWTSPRDLSNASSIFLFNTERKITIKGLAQIGSGLLPVGTVLLSSRAPIGYLAITEIPVAINQGYIAILCDKLVSNYFIFLWCRVNIQEIENAGNGSVFQEISKSSFKGLSFIIPPKEKLSIFDTQIEPIFLKIKLNQIQVNSLTQTRDNLLPKLMSGEVRVSELNEAIN
jgi:type I restriction enzyme S subunit